MNRGVIIETISVGHPDYQYQEFIALANTSAKRVHLGGWRLVWIDLQTGRELHDDTFNFSHDDFFDPGEKLFLVSGVGNGCFVPSRRNIDCLVAHWLMFTGSRKHICSVPQVKVTLYDANDKEVVNPAIKIDGAWRRMNECHSAK